MSEPSYSTGPDDGWLVAWRIRNRRVDLQLRQEDVRARLSEVLGQKVSQSTLSRLEAGKSDVAKGTMWLRALSEALDCSVTFLVGLTDDPDRWEPDAKVRTSARGRSKASRTVAQARARTVREKGKPVRRNVRGRNE